MPPLRPRDLTMPLAAFGMVFVLGSYVYASMNKAKRDAHHTRERKLEEILESRKRLGMDDDQSLARERRRAARLQADSTSATTPS